MDSLLKSLLASGLLVLLAGCASPRLQTPGDAPQTPRLAADRVEMADGVPLPLSTWLPAGKPRAVLLALHGFNDYRVSFDGLGRYLADRGTVVYAYDQRGFGASGQRGLWPGGDVLADDARTVAGLLRQRHPNVPFYVLGESMGGAVLLRALARHPASWLDGALLMAPAVWGRSHMPWYQKGALWLLAHSWPSLELSGRGLGYRPSDNPEALRRLRNDPLVIKATRVDTIWGLADLMDSTGLNAQDLDRAPRSLILYGERDEIIPREPTCAWLAGLPDGGSWRLAVYPEGWHLLTRDLHGGVVQADIAAWLVDPGGLLPSGLDGDEPRRRVCPEAGF